MRSPILLNFYRQISQQTLTVVDVETTGIKAGLCRVIEVSVLQGSLATGIDWQETHLINPEVPVPAEITRLTGITQEMVDQAPSAIAVWPKYQDCLQTGILTAHNLGFDYRFLQSEYARLGVPYHRPSEKQFCTVKLARLLLADLPSRSLPHLVAHFGFNVGPAHRAAADTLACWMLAKHLLTRIQDTPEAKLLQQINQTWISLTDAAQLLRCEPMQAALLLEQAGISPQPSRRRRTASYARGQVEALATTRIS